MPKNDVENFEGWTVEQVLRKLKEVGSSFEEKGVVKNHLDFRCNNAPSIRDVVALANENSSVRCSGNIVYKPREDFGVYLEGFTIRLEGIFNVYALLRRYGNADIMKVTFWWD